MKYFIFSIVCLLLSTVIGALLAMKHKDKEQKLYVATGLKDTPDNLSKALNNLDNNTK